MTGIPNYYIQIWEKYVGKVKPEGGDREDWIETCSRLYWGVRNLGEDAIVLCEGTPSFRAVVNHAGLFWFSMYRFSVFNGAPPAVPA